MFIWNTERNSCSESNRNDEIQFQRYFSEALLLAGVGLYAVLNYSVLQRRREIGIRIAIGSSRAGIVRIVTSDVFLMVALGGCAGIALGLAAARYIESLFYQVKASDMDMIAS